MAESAATMPTRLPTTAGLLMAQIRYQLRTMLRSPRAVFAGIALPAVLLVLSDSKQQGLPINVMAGFGVLGLTITAWSTHGISLVGARQSGVLKRWRATPLPRWCYFVARLTSTVLLATVAGAVPLIMGRTLFGVHLAMGGVLLALGMLVLGALAWAAPATAITALIPNADSAWPILSLTFLPIVLVSGVFGSLSNVPQWITAAATYFPAQPVINAVTRALHGAPISAHDLLTMACWIAGGFAASLVFFRWEPRLPAAGRHTRHAEAPARPAA
ncbi:MAG: ABC transporter permease [Actinomycetota bacterium]